MAPKLPGKTDLLPEEVRNAVVQFASGGTPSLAEQTGARGVDRYRSSAIMSAGFQYLGIYDPSQIGPRVKKKMLLDPQLRLGLAAVKAPAYTAPLSVDSPSREVKSLVEEIFLERIRRPALKHHFHSIDFGYQVDELLWGLTEKPISFDYEDEKGTNQTSEFSGYVIDSLKDLDPEDFHFVSDPEGHIVGISQTAIPVADQIVPMEKILHYTTDIKWGGPYGNGRLDGVYEPWYWASVIYLFANQYFERRAVPLTVIYVNPNVAVTDPDTSEKVANPLETIASNIQEQVKGQSVIALKSEFDAASGNRLWDMKTLEDDPRGEMFVAYIEHLNVMKLRGIFMPERAVTQDTKIGSQAMARTHKDVVEVLSNDILDDYVGTLNNQALPRFLAANGITEKAKLKHGGVAGEAVAMYQDVLGKLFAAEQAILEGDAIGDIGGLMVDVIDSMRLMERMGIPLRDTPTTHRSPRGNPQDANQPAGEMETITLKGDDPARWNLATAISYEVAEEVELAEDVVDYADLRDDFDEYMDEAEEMIQAEVMTHKEELGTREKVTKAIILLMLLRSKKTGPDGTKIPGINSYTNLVYNRAGKLRSHKLIAKNLPKLEAAAATLDQTSAAKKAGGLRISKKGNIGLMRKTLRDVEKVFGQSALVAGLGRKRMIEAGVGNLMELAAKHYRTATQKGAYGITANLNAILRGGYPGRVRGKLRPGESAFRGRSKDVLDVNVLGIVHNIENIGIRAVRGLVEMVRNAFGTARLLEAKEEVIHLIPDWDPEDEAAWTPDDAYNHETGEGSPVFSRFKVPGGEPTCLGIAKDLLKWQTSDRYRDLTLESHLRGAYRGALFHLAEEVGYKVFLGIHPEGTEPEVTQGGSPAPCREFDETAATKAWWDAKGDVQIPPVEPSLFGLGYGCRMYFFPLPPEVIESASINVEI